MKFKYTFPDMKEYIMPNGMRIIWLPDFTYPVITLALLIPAGRYLDPINREGTADLTVGLMQKGTKTFPLEKFAEEIENSGVSLFVVVKNEYITLGARMLNKVSEKIIPIFWEMLCNPTFDKKEFKRTKKEFMTSFKAEFADPSAIASKHFNAELFGPSNFSGRMPSIFSVKNIKYEHIIDFYSSFIVPQESTLIVSGAFSVENVQKPWEEIFSKWKSKRTKDRSLNITIPSLTENKIRLINKPDLSQTTLLIGHSCIHELHEKKMTLAIANFILGGGNFSSRLMSKIRSDTGKTYGIASRITTYRNFGTFSLSTSTQNNQLKEVLASIFKVYSDFAQNGPTDSEIEKAKQFAIGNMSFELEGINNVIEKLLWLRFFNRDNSYIESYTSHLKSINSKETQDALNKYFASDHFVIIAVGKMKEIQEQLAAYGNVKHFTHRSNPIQN